jgi:hypothetical protein
VEERMSQPQLTDLPTIGENTVQQLVRHGFRTVRDLVPATIEQIRAVRGFSAARASVVRQAAKRLLEEYENTTSAEELVLDAAEAPGKPTETTPAENVQPEDVEPEEVAEPEEERRVADSPSAGEVEKVSDKERTVSKKADEKEVDEVDKKKADEVDKKADEVDKKKADKKKADKKDKKKANKKKASKKKADKKKADKKKADEAVKKKADKKKADKKKADKKKASKKKARRKDKKKADKKDKK